MISLGLKERAAGVFLFFFSLLVLCFCLSVCLLLVKEKYEDTEPSELGKTKLAAAPREA